MSQQGQKKCIHLTAVQKFEICSIKQREPNKKNVDLAREFGISTGQPECVAKIGWYINQTNNKNKQKQDSKKNFDEPIVMDDCNNDIQESIDEDQIVNELYNEFQNDSTFLIDDVYTVDNGEDEVPKLTEIFNFELVEKSLKDDVNVVNNIFCFCGCIES
ncbi:12266_t:CDS:2 [Entrophospora sp. SA101]|nr:12266_t:CDS:2 [Entrophospora sp. SA101]